MRIFPRIASLVVAAAVATTGLSLSTPTADAATKPSVSIGKIAGKKAPYRKKVSVSIPKVSTKGSVDLDSTTFTIKHGKKTVARNKTTAKLKAGKYRVTTKARYRTWTMVTKYRTDQQVVVLLPAYTSVTADCLIQQTDAGVNSGLDLVLTCASTKFPESQTVSGHAVGSDEEGWTIAALTTFDPPVAVSATPLVGASVSLPMYFTEDLTRVETVKVPYQERKYSAMKSKTRTQSLRIKQGKKPGRTDPISTWNCPSWAPIKGNAQSMIYHMPGQRFYKATKPEDCFSTQHAAKKAGYRKSKV